MTELRRISYLWKDAEASKGYSTGVSLHSHTNQSKETLDFLANVGAGGQDGVRADSTDSVHRP